MKHLLTILASAALLIGILILANGRYKTQSETKAIARLDEDTANAVRPDKNPDEAFARWDGLVYMLEFGNEYIDNSMNGPAIKAYRGDYCVDSCIIQGVYNSIKAEHGNCMIVTGIDTVRFNLTYMPKILDLRYVSALPEADTLTFYKTFCINDESFDCSYSAETALLPGTPQGILQYIDSLLLEHTNSFGLDFQTPAAAYRGDKTDIKAMIEHYYGQFREGYAASCQDDTDSQAPVRGPAYHYFFSAKPVWQSKDKRLVTYQFYDYGYTMGSAHGGMEEYFATFDAETGRRLHIRDVISPKGFRKCISLLESQLTGYKKSQMEYEGICQAELDDYYHEMPAPEDYTLREIFEHHLYPIPALTRHGIVFSYQPYEKGSFAEGVLHFTIPYAQISNFLRAEILTEHH